MTAFFLSLLLGITTFVVTDVPIISDPIKVGTHSHINPSDEISLFGETGYNVNFIANTLLMDWGWCGHGGPGTRACSVGIGIMSCSIDCRDGQHACCSFFFGCRCRDDAPDDQPNEEEGKFYAIL